MTRREKEGTIYIEEKQRPYNNLWITEKGKKMRQIVKLLLGIMLICVSLLPNAVVSARSDGGEVTARMSLNGVVTQAELIHSDSVSGVVTVSNQTGHALSATVTAVAYSKGQPVGSQVMHRGEILPGVMPFSFTIDQLKQADCVRAFVLSESTAAPLCPAARDGLKPAQVIVIKLDDSSSQLSDQPERFDEVLSYLAGQNIPAAAGIFGKWLEEVRENPEEYRRQLELMRSWAAEGHQLWIHGYDGERGEFAAMGETAADSLEQQAESLQTSYDLMKSVLQYQATCFGPAYQQNNEDTVTVLNREFPQIQTVLFMNDPNGRLNAMNFSKMNICSMELPGGVVSYPAFLACYERMQDAPYLVLEGHPGLWNERGKEGLECIISFLQQQNCIFMTPAEYDSVCRMKG